MNLFRTPAVPQPEPIPPAAAATPAPPPSERPKSEVPISTLSAGVNFSMTGDTANWDSPTEDLNILGRFEGRIRVRTLLIGPGAVVKGHIQADNLVVEGQIDAETRAGKVLLHATSHVLGRLVYDEMVMRQGARLSGSVVCEQDQDHTKSERPATAPINDGIFGNGATGAGGFVPRLVEPARIAGANN